MLRKQTYKRAGSDCFPKKIRLWDNALAYSSNLVARAFSFQALWHSAMFRLEHRGTLDVVHWRSRNLHYNARCNTSQLTTSRMPWRHLEVLVDRDRCNLCIKTNEQKLSVNILFCD